MVELVDTNINDSKSTNYIIKLLHINTKVVTKDFLKYMFMPDIVSIPISSKDYINNSRISDNKIDDIMFT